MRRITKKDRLHLLQMACDVAAEGAKNTNVVWMLEFQELLVETLYRKMSALLEADLERCADDDEDEEAEAEPKPAEVRKAPPPPTRKTVAAPPPAKRSGKKAKAA